MYDAAFYTRISSSSVIAGALTYVGTKSTALPLFFACCSIDMDERTATANASNEEESSKVGGGITKPRTSKHGPKCNSSCLSTTCWTMGEFGPSREEDKKAPRSKGRADRGEPEGKGGKTSCCSPSLYGLSLLGGCTTPGGGGSIGGTVRPPFSLIHMLSREGGGRKGPPPSIRTGSLTSLFSLSLSVPHSR